jgi:ankyrin repeat protein
VGRAVMKLFEYKVEPEQHAAMAYVTDVLDALGVGRDGSIGKMALCKFMLSDRFAVHYVKQCTGEGVCRSSWCQCRGTNEYFYYFVDKPKLYVMMEKDAEFLGAIEFSNEQQMRTTSLRTVRDMIYAQVQRVPDDFLFLCQGRQVEKVWEVDRRAWSIVPFALRGSPGFRTDIMAKNRSLERPSVTSPFEFRYMGNLITRYKKRVHEIKPVYKHRGFRLRKNAPTKRLEPRVQWRVATTWSGEWIYAQQLIQKKSKSEILKSLRTAAPPEEGVLMVKSHFGEILSPCLMVSADNAALAGDLAPSASIEDRPPTSSQPEKRMQRIVAMTLHERKHEDKLRKQSIQWKARLIAMEAQHQMEEQHSSLTEAQQCGSSQHKQAPVVVPKTAGIQTVLVHIEEDNVLPSRIVHCEPKKRPRPKKLEWSTCRWDIPGRLLPSLPPKCKRMKVSKISDDISLAAPVATSTKRQLGLGRFLSSTHIFLDDNEVEVFPVLVLRPVEEQVCMNDRVGEANEDAVLASPPNDAENIAETLEETLFASKSYLTEFEYEISATESNFEALYQHVASGTLHDAILLNRRDVFGRAMLHDAAEFGHANVMELLLKARVIVDIQDSRGDTPLHHAARHGRLKEVSLLLREHATPWLLNAEGKSPLHSALETAAKRSPARSVSLAEAKSSEAASNSNSSSLDGQKNFFLAHRTYPQLRQVIDLLWDNYKLEHIVKNDSYDRMNCFELEKQVYGDMIQACHDGNLLRVQRLVDLEKRPVLRYINDQMAFLHRTALHEATEQGHTATVDLLLKLGADGSLRDQRLQAPLHLAAWKGYDKIVKCLIAKFPLTVANQDITGCTPLHLAIQQKRWGIALELISLAKANGDTDGFSAEGQRGNCLSLQDNHGYTSLHYACVHGCFEVCEALVNAGTAVSVSQCEYRIVKGACHLIGVWWKGDLKRIGNRKSLEAAPIQCKVVNIEAPVEMLIQGCKQDLSNLQERFDVLELLLHHEHAVDATQGPRDLVKVAPSPLFHIAAQLADINISVAVEICRRLHKLQVEINMPHPLTKDTVLLQECKRVCRLARNCSGATSPDYEMASQLALIRSLLELGANVDLANEDTGESPLGCAAWYGHLALLDLLLEAGADKDGFLRRCSFSPLHFAALGNNVACAKMLIGRSAIVNVELPPANAETPLYFAIRSRSEAIVDLLLRSSADPCSLCTMQQDRSTSFGVVLSLPTEVERGRGIHSKTLDTQQEAVAPIVSPLTFGLLVSRSLRVFGVSEELHCTVERSRKHSEWAEMKRICLLLAKRLLEENGGSKGVVSHEDVRLASVLGFWDLVELLLTQQVALSNAPSSYGLNALHLAAAAGQTKVVAALVAGGMDVNCIIRNDSWQPKQTTDRRVRYELIGWGHRGALFYALIHGHTETAARLLVLGASAEQTIPHSQKTVRWRLPKGYSADKAFCEHIVLRFVVSESMIKAARTDQLERRGCSSHQGGNGHDRIFQVDEASVNLTHLIECSVNQKVPLLHLVVALGHFRLTKVLVGAGMSIFSGFITSPTDESSIAGFNAPAETPIHLAIACGHLEIVKFFASTVQNQFPGCFVREGKSFKSLLVTACESHQASILRFLLGHNEGDGGGGFAYESCKDEFQSALHACAAVQFVEGFELLVQYGATPDVHTLVSTLKGITQKSKNAMASARVNEIEILEREKSQGQPAFRGERYQHDFRTNSVEVATKLLDKILSPEYIGDISNFIGTSPVFELVQKVLIICSRYQLWFVLDQVFLCHQEYFVDVASIWKPVLVRAASSSLILHRAAMHNQANVVAFFLRLGVPANLRVGQLLLSRNPLWYAATRGSLEAFLCLVLHLSRFTDELECCRVLNALPLTFRSITESRSSWSTSNTTCRWQNLCVFGCIDLPKRHTNGYLIQKFINYGLQISRGHTDNSLLHHACRRGELIAVQALVDAGADLAATNRNGETPLEVASARKDSFGVSIVRYLLSALAHNQAPAAANIKDRALARCFAQGGSGNLMIAQALLDAGASACFSRKSTDDEAGYVAQNSAIFYAMQTAQLAGVRLLLDHEVAITVELSEVFLAQFLMDAKHSAQSHWRRFSRLVKHNGGKARLLDVEGVMKILLEKNVFAGAMNSDLVHQMLTSAAALATTIAQEMGVAKRFWDVVNTILDRYPKDVSSQKTEWNQKSALHYAVGNKEVQIVNKLLRLRGFDVLAMDEKKQTPLHLAAVGGDEMVCRLLLEKLQSNTAKTTAIDVLDVHGRTALHLAVIHGHEAVAGMLLAAGASVDIRCRDGLTTLLYAAKCNRLAILIALFSQSVPKPHGALLAANGDAGLFVAARYGAFPVVRWFMNLYEEGADTKTSVQGESILRMHCSFGRKILHYSAVYGDEETVRLLLKLAGREVQGLVNARDKWGYTPLMYAIAFGKLRIVRMLCEAGADPYASVDHSGDPGAHPYTVGFDISGLLQWFALPGWYSFACKFLPPEEKPRLVRVISIEDDYLSHSSYNYRKKRGKPPVEWRCKWKRIPAARLLKSEPRHRGKLLTRSSMRTWRFPQRSIFDFACEIGNGQMVEFLVNLRLPQLFHGLSYQAQRRNFLQAVRWNRLDVVKSLVSSAAPGSSAIESTTGNHFLDFLEAGIECSISRGLEEMAIYLVNQWQGVKENGLDSATPSAFAFQFASAFQVACIRQLPRLMERMIERGGEQLVEFHLNEGPALVYAFAFGNVDIAALLLRSGADPSMPTATYSVPSIRKWVEFGSSKDVQVSWQPRADDEMNRSRRPAFVGPLDVYEAPTPRLALDELCRTFASVSVTSVHPIPTSDAADRFCPVTTASERTLQAKEEAPQQSEDQEGLSTHGNNCERDDALVDQVSSSESVHAHDGNKVLEEVTRVEDSSEPSEPTPTQPVNNERDTG